MTNTGTLYFFTGLAGAGKTTIGGLFYRRLKVRKNDVVLIDGDQVRAVFGLTGYSTEARKSAALSHIFPLCKMLTEQNIDVVLCNIAMYEEVRSWGRENIEHYQEIYIKVSMETLQKRDQKGLYSTHRKEVVGVDLPWDEPKTPDVIIENDGAETPEIIVERLERTFGLHPCAEEIT